MRIKSLLDKILNSTTFRDILVKNKFEKKTRRTENNQIDDIVRLDNKDVPTGE